MKPWIHPQVRRSRIYWWVQLPIVVLVMILAAILLLREPTQEHVIIVAGIEIIGILGLILGVKMLRRLPKDYRYEAEAEGGVTKQD